MSHLATRRLSTIASNFVVILTLYVSHIVSFVLVFQSLVCVEIAILLVEPLQTDIKAVFHA